MASGSTRKKAVLLLVASAVIVVVAIVGFIAIQRDYPSAPAQPPTNAEERSEGQTSAPCRRPASATLEEQSLPALDGLASGEVPTLEVPEELLSGTAAASVAQAYDPSIEPVRREGPALLAIRVPAAREVTYSLLSSSDLVLDEGKRLDWGTETIKLTPTSNNGQFRRERNLEWQLAVLEGSDGPVGADDTLCDKHVVAIHDTTGKELSRAKSEGEGRPFDASGHRTKPVTGYVLANYHCPVLPDKRVAPGSEWTAPGEGKKGKCQLVGYARVNGVETAEIRYTCERETADGKRYKDRHTYYLGIDDGLLEYAHLRSTRTAGDRQDTAELFVRRNR